MSTIHSTNNNKQNNLQQWLQSINCLQSFTQNDILNGMLIYNIITHISPSSQSPSLKELSTSTSTLSRVSNWNILSEQLKKFGIQLTQQNKNKIIAGSQESVVDIVSQLKEYHLKKEKSSEVDLADIDPKKDPSDAKSLLELLLILMMKNFHLSAKQAVALLSNESKYLAHILTKGLKGEFKGIQTFLTQLNRTLERIIEFCKSNQQNVFFFLRSIKPALISKSQSVSSMCLHFFNKFMLNYEGRERLMIFQTHLLTTYVLTIKRHLHMESQVIVSMLEDIVGEKMEKTSHHKNGPVHSVKGPSKDQQQNIKQMRTNVMELLWGSLTTDSERYSMVLTILRTFGERSNLQDFMELQFFSKRVEKSIEAIKDQQHSLTCIDIVLALNQYIPSLFSQQHSSQFQQRFNLNTTELAQTLIQNLSSLKFPAHPIPLTNQLFTLLHNFGQEKHFIAPSIYKLILEKFSQVQDINSDIYQVYLGNFVQTIREFPSIPWNGLLDVILARKKQESDKEGIQMNEIQLEFFFFLLGQDNLEVKNALMIYDIVSKTFMETYHLAGHITKLIVRIVDLFARTEPIVEELTIKLIKVCLAIHHANTKKLSHKRKSLTGNTKLSHQEALMKVKNNSIQFLTLKLCQLKVDKINSKVEPLVAFSYVQMKDKSEFVKGFKNILAIFGNLNEIIEKYEKEIRKAEQEAKLQQKLQKEKQKEREKEKMQASKIGSKIHSKNRYDLESLQSARKQDSFIQESGNPLFLPSQQKGQSISLHNNSFNRSYLGITSSAQKGIQKFQKVYLTKIQKQDFQKIRKQQEEQKFEMMKKLYRKKMMSHGIDIKGEEDQIQYLFEFDSQENVVFEKHFARIPYYSNDTEEDRDMMAVDKLLKSYQKSLRLVFSIYSGQKRGNMPQNFDQIAEKNVFISSSAVYKFMKDFGFQDYISLKQVQYLTQKINIQINPQTSDYQTLELDGFIEFIKQSSFLMFTRPPKDLRGHPLTMMLEQTLSNFKLFATQNKINEQNFQDPANIFFNETEAVAELNKKLAKNPDYILPEGYKKIVEKKISFEYGIYLQAMSPTYKVVFQVVDWLLNKALGVHVIQPFTKEEKLTKARPALFVAQRLKIDAMPTRHIPVNLKKEITKIPIKSRPDAKQCAIVLDDIITAIQLGHTNIGQKHVNKLQIQRRKQTQQQLKQLQIQKRRRLNRNRQAKSAIEQYNQKKQQKQKQHPLKKQEEQKRLKEQKDRKEKQEKQLKRKLEEYTKKKKQEEEEKLRKKKEQEEKEKKEREKFKQMNEQTKKKLQEEKKKKEEQQMNKKSEKEQEEKKLKQLEKKKMQQSQSMKKKMVEEFKLRKSQVRETVSGMNKGIVQEKKNLQSFVDAQNELQ